MTVGELCVLLDEIDFNQSRIDASNEQLGFKGGVGVPAIQKGSWQESVALEIRRIQYETGELIQKVNDDAGVKRIRLICESENGEKLNLKWLNRVIAEYCLQNGTDKDTVNCLEVNEFSLKIHPETTSYHAPKPDGSIHNPEGEKIAKVDDRINIVRETGSGEYATIWEGEQSHLNRKVAIKIIDLEMRDRASALAHAKVLARVDTHENIVTVYDVARIKAKQFSEPVDALVMEWLEGDNLQARLDGPIFELELAMQICRAVVSGVKYMHSNEIAHGDLHPGNVMICAEAIKLIDIDATNDFSAMRQTSMSLENLKASDVSSVAYVSGKVLLNSKVDFSNFCEIEPRLRASRRLEEIESLIDELSATAHSDNGSAPAPTSDENTDQIKRGPDIRVRADLCLAGQPSSKIPFAGIHIENHDSTPIFISSIGMQLNDGRKLVVMKDEITGRLLTRRELKPGDSLTWPILLENITQNEIDIAQLACAFATDAIGRNFTSEDNVQELFQSLKSLDEKNRTVQ